QMESLLEGIAIPGQRHRVFSFDYQSNTGFGTHPEIQAIAGRLKDCIDVIRSKKRDDGGRLVKTCNGLQVTDAEQKELRAAPKVHIIAHSMGGLVTRAYISGMARREGVVGTVSFENDIGKFITLATPHFGTVWSGLAGTQVAQMSYGSRFLWDLHKAWTNTAYWRNSQSSMMTIVALGDGTVPDHASAAYVNGASVAPRYVYKDHTSLSGDCNGAAGQVGGCDGVAKVDVCHASYQLVRSFMLGQDIASSGQTPCHAPSGPMKRDERWQNDSTRNEGSLLLRVTNATGSPLQVAGVTASPFTVSTGGTSDAGYGTYHIRGMAPKNYQLTITASPYQNISRTATIARGRTTVLDVVVGTLATAQQPGPLALTTNNPAPVGPGITTTANLSNYHSQPLAATPAHSIVTTVSAANFAALSLAPESIATAFGVRLASATEIAVATPLPTTLAGTTVVVRDSAGAERSAPLLFVSPTQVNFQIPLGTSLGPATVIIADSEGHKSTGVAQIETV
ncbi:MAG: carboxypeptidase regulatory-like domain-containing protein, partial [Candidatus Binatia bacterium]